MKKRGKIASFEDGVREHRRKRAAVRSEGPEENVFRDRKTRREKLTGETYSGSKNEEVVCVSGLIVETKTRLLT